KALVHLCNVPVPTPVRPRDGLTEDFVSRLTEFVKNGGGLVIGCGPHAEAAEVHDGPADPRTGQPTKVLAPYYNRVLGSDGAGLLPFNLTTDITGVAEVAPAMSPFNPAPESIDPTSYLAPFREPPFSFIVREVRISRLVRLDESGPGSAGGRVLVRTTDQKPFIASRVVGDGEVVLVATTLDERWTDFPGVRGDAFV